VLALGLGLACPTREGGFDFDGDGYPDDIDCAPEDASIHPEAVEDCTDAVDNDCDDEVDSDDPDCGTGDDDSAATDDLDGDGYTVDEGDCDDGDPAVHPGADDVCNGIDDDCDGFLNEDSEAWDAYENDDPMGSDLGNLTDTTHMLGSFLQAPDDVDRYRFRVDDTYEVGTDDFAIQVEVLLPGNNVDIMLQLELVEDVDGQPGDVLHTVNDVGPGETETLDFQGLSLHDDTGAYAIEVTALSGYDCEMDYTLVFDCAG